MKICLMKFLLLPALIAALCMLPAGQLSAQTLTTLHNFDGVTNGGNPTTGLLLTGSTLYGTTDQGGQSGTLFRISTDGLTFSNIYTFLDDSHGFGPAGVLILSNNLLYSTAQYSVGGSAGQGTVFSITTNGTSITTLHGFTNYAQNYPDGRFPVGGVILSSNILYGTTSAGGSNGNGVIFRLNINGLNFTNLHSFATTNGVNPISSLTLSGATLYGTTYSGGARGQGAVFRMNNNGSGYTNLHDFFQQAGGQNPSGHLVLSGNTLYGTAQQGGKSWGMIYAMNTDGTGFTNLHNFGPPDDQGAGLPEGGLLLVGNTLYGTANRGGDQAVGSIYAINTDGSGFTNLYTFSYPFAGTNSDGAYPNGDLVLSGNALYGTTYNGGTAGYGTVFRLSLGPPRLTITSSGTNVILTWPTNVTGFTLQSNTKLVSSAVWSNVVGQFAVTNPISGTQKFYRLSQ
jgi:uncharacterized repeat protein (TIGR03803 family)